MERSITKTDAAHMYGSLFTKLTITEPTVQRESILHARFALKPARVKKVMSYFPINSSGRGLCIIGLVVSWSLRCARSGDG